MFKTASDLMQTPVVTVGLNTPISSVRRLFFEEGIQAAPVATEEGRVVGMITATDLLRVGSDETGWGSPVTPFGLSVSESDDEAGLLDGWHEETLVADAMSESLLGVEPKTDIQKVARLLYEHRLHHILVIDSENVIGIISSFDLLKVFCADEHWGRQTGLSVAAEEGRSQNASVGFSRQRRVIERRSDPSP